jgi:predicted methyltransferase
MIGALRSCWRSRYSPAGFSGNDTPGGRYVIIDHAAAAGSGLRDTNTLHRIDKASVKSEVEAAGFKLERESDLLRNAGDPRTVNVRDPTIRGKTDQFILEFRKPKH